MRGNERGNTTTMTEPFAVSGTDEGLWLSPTDISQFIRLEQCERYLRLRLHERNENPRFVREYGVAPASIPPLLTRSGAAFERQIMGATTAHYPTTDFTEEYGKEGARTEDNAAIAAIARDLSTGTIHILYQPRLNVPLAGWQIRGDVDILRLERDGDGALHALIADMKSSTRPKVEHRLQVAFYAEMLAALFAMERVACADIAIAVLYRGSADDRDEAHAAAARAYFGTDVGFLEIVPDAADYRRSIRDLVTAPTAAARRVIETPFDTLPYHLNVKCDGCLYNEVCMKRSVERDDLSLLPHLTPNDKNALLRAGVMSVSELATLKEPAGVDTPAHHSELVPAPGAEELTRALAATWPVGPRLDELIHRARRYRQRQGDPISALGYIPSKGYGSLPYCDAAQNPNLIRVYIDVQHDYLEDRVYLLGALVAASEGGKETDARRRTIVEIADGPPDSTATEQALFLRWIAAVLRAVVEVAAPDDTGAMRAPVHLIFFNRHAQQLLLEGLARHLGAIFGATPCYDFVTQLAAFDSPVASFLDEEIRELKNYPIVCQSLQSVAAILKFDWNTPEPFASLFHERLFDARGKLEPNDETSPWYTRRARFNSQIPLEYAYAAWDDLGPPRPGKRDEFAPYRGATIAHLRAFQSRRLEAIEHIARQFTGNKQTEKRPFDLPDLGTFMEKARTRADALDEFVMIERHVELGAWKAARLLSPERRVLMGQTLLARYDAASQPPDVAARNADNRQHFELAEEYKAAALRANPDVGRGELTKEQKQETKWSQATMQFRLDLVTDGIDCPIAEALALTTLRIGDSVVVFPRLTVDARLPEAERTPFTPTPKQMLYGTRATIKEINARTRTVLIEMAGPRGKSAIEGFAFSGIDQPLRDGERYTLDPDPNNWYGHFCASVIEELCAGGANTLAARLDYPDAAPAAWSPEAAAAQQRFLAGLDALHDVGALHPFEPGKRDFIGAHGNTPTLLVQGPPGTGKSYSTAFALFARLQGAIAADQPFRAFVSCKTHAATNVLLDNIVTVRAVAWPRREPAGDLRGAFRRPHSGCAALPRAAT